MLNLARPCAPWGAVSIRDYGGVSEELNIVVNGRQEQVSIRDCGGVSKEPQAAEITRLRASQSATVAG